MIETTGKWALKSITFANFDGGMLTDYGSVKIKKRHVEKRGNFRPSGINLFR